MLLVVDSNILFTSFWENSTFNGIVKTKQVTLISPDYALKEIHKYAEEIKAKAKLSQQDFESNLQQLKENVHFIKEKDYKDTYKNIKAALTHLEEDEQEEILLDIDFLALSIAKNCSLWSNDKALKDKALKKQKKVSILTTEEMITLFA